MEAMEEVAEAGIFFLCSRKVLRLEFEVYDRRCSEVARTQKVVRGASVEECCAMTFVNRVPGQTLKYAQKRVRGTYGGWWWWWDRRKRWVTWRK